MSKEAMKLALGELQAGYVGNAMQILREALAKPDFWEGYVPEPDKRQQALDKKAENARELGLDYEPAQQEQWDAIPDAFNEWWNADYDDTGNPYRKDSPAYWAWSGWKAASKQPEQEPVAWASDVEFDIETEVIPAKGKGRLGTSGLNIPLYTSQPPQRKPLTDEEIKIALNLKSCEGYLAIVRAIEAAHGIKENT